MKLKLLTSKELSLIDDSLYKQFLEAEKAKDFSLADEIQKIRAKIRR